LKVTVVGAGIMGLSAAWALVRLGHSVTVLDRGPVPNPRGASFDQHRLIRYPYGAALGYTAMVAEAYRAWDEVWADLGERLYVPTGTLAVGATGTAWVRDSADALQALGLQVDWLEPARVAARFPLLSSEAIAGAFHTETGGVLLADRIVTALARHLAGRGATVVPHAQVHEIDPLTAAVTLADGRRREADAVVIAAGAWVPRLVPELRARVIPSRQVLVYLEPPAEMAASWSAHPLVLDIGPESGFYLVPPVAGTALKIGDHTFSMAGDPDDPRDVAAEEAAPVFESCRRRLAGFDRYRLASARACYYAVEPEERFVVERREKAWVMSACSGHAFKFGPVLGKRLAEAIVGRADPSELARWAAGQEDHPIDQTPERT
jgi:glycine/D-amino acid oxidase-like deaminating enzyme